MDRWSGRDEDAGPAAAAQAAGVIVLSVQGASRGLRVGERDAAVTSSPAYPATAPILADVPTESRSVAGL